MLAGMPGRGRGVMRRPAPAQGRSVRNTTNDDTEVPVLDFKLPCMAGDDDSAAAAVADAWPLVGMFTHAYQQVASSPETIKLGKPQASNVLQIDTC